jgi:hypothetical protein
MSADDTNDRKRAEDANDKKGLVDEVQTISRNYEELKGQFDAATKSLKIEIEKTHAAIESLDKHFKNNNTRIAWRHVNDLHAPDRNREQIYKFEVDFAPNQPLSGRPEHLQVLVAGFSYIRQEHDVSHLHGWTRNVKLQGTKVTGEYCFNLSDNDNNSVVDNRSSLRLLVIAMIEPVK